MDSYYHSTIDQDQKSRDILARPGYFSNTSAVDVFEVTKGIGGRWRENLSDLELMDSFLSPNAKSHSEQNTSTILRVFSFLSGGRISIASSTLAALFQAYSISPEFLYILTGNRGCSGYFTRYASDGVPHSLHSFYKHSFNKESIDATYVYMVYALEGHCQTYICVNLPEKCKSRLQQSFYKEGYSQTLYFPFFLDIVIADETITLYQNKALSLRRLLIEIEIKGPSVDLTSETKKLHERSQHYHILEGNLSGLESALRMLVKLQKRMKTLQDRISSTYIEEASISELPDVVTAADMFEESIGCLQERVDYWRRWILLYKDRINIQINLVFHLITKRDSQATVLIARQNAKIAEDTNRDSMSMSSIATLTMAFLPATFVASLFQSDWLIKPDDGALWRIYIAVAVPLTVLVFVLWLGWTRFSNNRRSTTADMQAIEDLKLD